MPSIEQSPAALKALLSVLEDRYADALIENKEVKYLHELWEQIRQLRTQLELPVYGAASNKPLT